MGIAQTDLINEAEGHLTAIQMHVDAQVRLNHQDVLIGIESLCCELLNRVYGWNLKNDNFVGRTQQDSFDLSDRGERIAVQVTHTTKPAKIRETLATFVGKHDSTFDRLVFVYPCNKASASKANFDSERKSFDFDSKRDRLDFGNVLLKARALPIDDLANLVRFLRQSIPQILRTPLANDVAVAESLLSKIPHSLRPTAGLALHGRDDVLQALSERNTDFLLVGQPGVGKTAVLSAMIAKQDGYFVHSGSDAALAAQLLAKNPRLVAVEDAHQRIDFIESLRFIRQQNSLTFRILADCWPARRDAVCLAMQLPTVAIIELQPVSNRFIIQMAKDVGISGPERFFHHLVRQSMGYPGRAAMLLRCCKDGDQSDIREFFTGESIAKWTKQLVEKASGSEAIDVLSCLAVGRDRGVPLSMIAEYFGKSIASVERIVTDFAAGGIVKQTQFGNLVVYPTAIRPVLIRDFFFGTLRRDIKHFSSDWRLKSVVAMSVVDAYCVGAKVDIQELFQLAEDSDSDEAWDRLAAAEDVLADMVLDKRPDLFDSHVHTFIERTPLRTIERLIGLKTKTRTRFDRQQDTRDQTVESWVKSGYPDRQAIPRRRITLDAIASQLSAGVPAEQAYRLLGCVLSPEYRATGQSPEDFDTFVLTSGLLSPNDLKELRGFWHEVFDLLKRYTPSDWSNVVEAIRSWLWPACSSPVNDEQREQLRRAAGEVLGPLCELCQHSPATLSALRRLGDYFEIDVTAEPSVEYTAIFPSESARVRTSEAHNDFERRCYQEAVELGRRWAVSEPAETLCKLKAFGEDAAKLGQHYPDYRDVICKTISQGTESRGDWIDEIIRQGLPAMVLLPFLRSSAEEQDEGISGRLSSCLRNDDFRPAAITILLADIDGMPTDLVKEAIQASGPYSQMLYVAALRNEIAAVHFLSLLSHSESSVRGNVAVGMWGQNREVPTDPEVLDKWRRAIARDCPRDHAIAEVFKVDPVVCRLWIEHWSAGMSLIGRGTSDQFPVASACEGLSVEERIHYLSNLSPDSPYRNQLIEHLVGGNETVFCYLLQTDSLDDFRLYPLRRVPDKAWVGLAEVALQSGISESAITNASGIGWCAEFDSVEDRHRAEIEAWDIVIDQHVGAIKRIASRRRLARMESLNG